MALKTAASAQDMFGLIGLLTGCLSKHWLTAQLQHMSSIHSHRTACQALGKTLVPTTAKLLPFLMALKEHPNLLSLANYYHTDTLSSHW